MKELIHNLKDSSICIYEYGDVIRGSFFKDKPEVGDILMSHHKRYGTSNLMMFEVTDIIENRDAVISGTCNYNPTKAYFRIGVQDVTEDERFADVDNHVQRLM